MVSEPSEKSYRYEIRHNHGNWTAVDKSTHAVLWQRIMDPPSKIAYTPGKCPHLKQLTYRADSSVLNSVCLNDLVAFVSGSSPQTLNLLHPRTGELFSFGLPKDAGDVEHIALGDNKLVAVFENRHLRRKEIKILEFFTEHLPRLPWKKTPPQHEAPAVSYYDAVYSLGVRDIDAIALTTTKQHVTPSTLVLISEGLLFNVPAKLFSARRPVGPKLAKFDNWNLAGAINADNDIPMYDSILPLVPFDFAHGNVLVAKPSQHESTTILDLGYKTLEFTPVRGFDRLPDNFSTGSTVITLALLLCAIFYVFKSAAKKRISDAWA